MKLLAFALLFSLSAFALESGKPAPDFKLDSVVLGKPVSLSDYKGKIVVLEWLNHGCPFVKKHYGSGNMQELQKKYVNKGVVWLSVISSAEGKQGYVTPEEGKKDKSSHGSMATDVLLDSKGTVGQMYGAKTTPHMYVIDKNGVLAYQGAIDDKADTDQESVKGARNYVAEAVDSLLTGRPVAVASTKSYGCGVKY
ncbi:MAG: thioredoxin family protein [Bacteriovoracaceae bacterium]